MGNFDPEEEVKRVSSKRNQNWWHRAQKIIPGGVNSPVRGFGAVGGVPVFMRRGEGPFVWDESGRKYIDFVGSWGPLILGHAYGPVVRAIQEAAARGTSFGTPTANEVRFAELIQERMPSMQQVRLVNSGTEAALSALRLARAHTGRTLILKFEGCYHGHVDQLLIAAGSGATTLGVPSSAGVPDLVAQQTVLAPYNDLQEVIGAVKKYPGQIAALIVEPVAGNMGVIPPEPGFLQGLRKLCSAEGIVLIFDEVMTGFRVSAGGAQELYGVRPDLSCLGKIIGGGLPVGAYGGRRAIMKHLAPLGPAYQAGTLSGNPVTVAAGLAALKNLRPAVYRSLELRAAELCQGLVRAAKEAGVELQVPRVGS
ncbi:MAG: glutamate-1-semialdehyde 2,1-aminomutase, partial [Candidatus Omnitrophica bacterium]|nr:glutamate-1-semialdehyde 2,1-aminomutase [Candidatus Omnitrophota bacterium]